MKLTLWHYLTHWLGFWCGMKIVKINGEVLVEYRCLACCKRDVTPEAWQRAFPRSF